MPEEGSRRCTRWFASIRYVADLSTAIYICMYIYIHTCTDVFMCMRVCVCVCMHDVYGDYYYYYYY